MEFFFVDTGQKTGGRTLDRILDTGQPIEAQIENSSM